jgi:serine/threonine protein kinase/WD40 repeat protein
MFPQVDDAPELGPNTLLEWVDSIADRFEARWRSGQPPRIADFLDDTAGKRRTTLLRELAKIDLERRVKAGQDRRWEDYLREFPELTEPEHEPVVADVLRQTIPAPPPRYPDHDSAPFRGGWDAPLAARWPIIEGYEILAELGHGAMGSVYKARQKELKRLVAIKVIRSTAQADPRYLARFRTEAEAVARLQHPNITQIYEVGQQDGIPYLALEYVDGGSLARWLAGKPQPGREAAEVVATLARAMHYAHEQGVVHRDLKPENILLQLRNGKGGFPEDSGDASNRKPTAAICIPKITDFGLAKLQENVAGLSLPGMIVGTPGYMAPEQAEGKIQEVGPVADTYALGAILYEMLTGGPPFKGCTPVDALVQVRIADPVPPSRLVPKVPRDVETICLKALSRAPASRYSSAGALADDLQRFLKGEPIQARPVGTAERLWRWCRRHPAGAGLVATAGALLIAVVTVSILVAAVSRTEAQARHRESLIGQLQLVRSGTRINGWSDEAWKLVVETSALRKDATLRSLAAAACSDLDARPGKYLEHTGVSWVAFDSVGRRLLLGGRNDSRGRPLETAKIWDLDSGRLTLHGKAGPGPVVFDHDGTPVQLVCQRGGAATTWNLAQEKLVSTCRLGPPVAQSPTRWLEHNALGLPILARATNGSVAAAAVAGGTGPGAVAAWDTASGRLLFRVAQAASALALAPGGNLLAGGNSQGQISLWTVPEGKETATLRMGSVAIHCLAFSLDGQRLAVGDSAGAVTVWDVAGRVPVAFGRGPQQEVFALAFSPDGTLLASGGRGPARLWDAATGHLVLSLRTTGLTSALVFAPDGRRLVVGSQDPARVAVWELEPGRGTRTLRGLTSQASHLCFSADSRLLAALGHHRTVAVWDLNQGQLRFLLPTFKSNANSDAGLAFSPDGRRFACSTEDGAKLWDAETGRELASWQLPRGGGDALAFHSSGALLLWREEPEENAAGAVRRRICRIRNLLGPAPSTPLAEITDLDGHLLDTLATPDGKLFLAEGTYRGPKDQCRAVNAYDSLTGARRWSIPSTHTPLDGTLALDSSGTVLALRTDNRPQVGSLAEVASGGLLGDIQPYPVCLGPVASDLVRRGAGEPPGEEHGYGLFRPGDASAQLVLGMDTIPSFRPILSRDGSLLAWSNADGTVSVCDLPQLRERLSGAGLEW